MPWHIQSPLHHELEQYRELGLIQDLNLDWMSDFSISPIDPEQEASNPSPYSIQFHQEPLSSFCVDRRPADALASIQSFVISSHWETFAKIVGKAAEQSTKEAHTLLTHSSWKAGTRAYDAAKLSMAEMDSLSELKLILPFSPFFSKRFSQWIPVRTTRDSLEIEMQMGLHLHPNWKDPFLSPLLFDLHLVWTTAFLLKWAGPLKHRYDPATKRVYFTRSETIPVSFPSGDE